MKRICIPIDMRAATRIKSAGGGNNCGIGKDGDAQYTLTCYKSFIPGVFYMECYEQHIQDSRIRGPLKKNSFLIFFWRRTARYVCTYKR